ncbi:MAG: TIGR01212 family radical SAM protein [Lachnospiraceae bacterium]|nr:TIGR01212 family radical SAM protein [Lachnospiraceae bacterium]
MIQTKSLWLDKPYYSLDAYFKDTFHHKCYKIALDAGMTCPNRDGSLDSRGCIFCSAGGSGDFAASPGAIDRQLAEGLAKFGDKKVGDCFMAYFQAYTNTYAPVEELRKIYTEALSHPQICGISIATRPDCLGEDVLALLAELKTGFPKKLIWVELGLQTIHKQTADYIRRGYPLSVFEEAAGHLQDIGIPYIVHVILGLPGETRGQMYETIQYLNRFSPFGIKLQLLHILKGTDLATDYEAGLFPALEKEEYLDILIGCIERLSPEIVLHRVTGDGPKALLLAPTWSLNKRDVLNSLHKEMKNRQTYQGRLYHATGSTDTV